MNSFEGRRLPDTAEGSFPTTRDGLRPGDIWKVLDRETLEPIVVTEYPSNLTRTAWMCVVPIEGNDTPDGIAFGNLRKHTVREEEDGTVSVRPGDGSSNSILVTSRWAGVEATWHGYVDHNIWSAC